jgi:predicted O-linked N-acetylglucosamine transferase (SPINDLY family)
VPYLDRALETGTAPNCPTELDAAWRCFQLGQVDEALAIYQEATGGGNPEAAHAAIAVIVPGSPRSGNQAILDARRIWAERYLPPARPARSNQRPQPSGAPLRIGYVSSFLQCDNWMKPVWGLINRHDRRSFQIHLFSDAPADQIKNGYRQQPEDCFYNIGGLGDDAVADLIEQARIDVLVDLNGYSQIERLPLFALRPAPVIVGWFNMYATTGMSCFDYLIGDDVVIPAEEEEYYCERIVRVPGSYLTFEVAYPVPEVTAPPCSATKRFTFGCLAPLYKITEQAVAAWSRILRGAPDSLLMLRNSALGSPEAVEFVHAMFRRQEISHDRYRLEGPAEHYEFLQTYDQIDLALDTFPYSGGTTTMEAIWQGVPVVTFLGDRWVARISASILLAANLESFVCQGLDDYVSTAIRLAQSPDRCKVLGELRRNMRSRLRQSPVCDTPAFALEMERIYHMMVDVSSA